MSEPVILQVERLRETSFVLEDQISYCSGLSDEDAMILEEDILDRENACTMLQKELEIEQGKRQNKEVFTLVKEVPVDRVVEKKVEKVVKVPYPFYVDRVVTKDKEVVKYVEVPVPSQAKHAKEVIKYVEVPVVNQAAENQVRDLKRQLRDLKNRYQ